MIEFERRSTKAERCEENGNRCGISSLITSLIGAGLGLLGGSDDKEKTTESTARTDTVPQWSEQQLPYLFGEAWEPTLPDFTAQSLNYGQALAGGYNPTYGPQGPVSFDQLRGGQATNQYSSENPWYLDPNAAANQQTGFSGISGLLGYGGSTPPPLLTNSPYYGENVANPEMLKTPAGGTSGLLGGGGQQNGQQQTAQGLQKLRGTLTRVPGSGLSSFGVRVGNNTLSMDEANMLERAGLLEIDRGESPFSPSQGSSGQGFGNLLRTG